MDGDASPDTGCSDDSDDEYERDWDRDDYYDDQSDQYDPYATVEEWDLSD